MDERLRHLIAEILDVPVNEVKPDMYRNETEAWDSMNHLRLMTAVEEQFGAVFTMDEIANIQTPDELQRVIESRRSQAPGA